MQGVDREIVAKLHGVVAYALSDHIATNGGASDPKMIAEAIKFLANNNITVDLSDLDATERQNNLRALLGEIPKFEEDAA